MLFGRTLYGGALYPRQVTAAGSAACVASVTATASSTRYVAGDAVAVASVAPSSAVRIVLPTSPQIEGRATVSGAPLASFALHGAAAGAAAVSGLAQAAFSPAGAVTAPAEVTGSIIRTIRYPLGGTRADCFATLEAGTAVYVLAYPEPGIVTARVFGTYWEVGGGESQPEASPTGSAQHVKHVGSTAWCTAQPVAAARVEAFAQGGAAATASADPDALHTTAAGIRLWATRGSTTAMVTASAVPYVYGVELAVARVTVTGTANTLRAAFGVATPRALLSADSERVYPEVASVAVSSSAAASGVGITAARGVAQVSATGGAVAAARVTATGFGGATGGATPVAQVIRLDLWPGMSSAGGVGSVDMFRQAHAGGQPGEVTAAPTASARLDSLAAGNATGGAMATAAGVFHPKIDAAGTVDATSSCSGFNVVNEAAQRLSARALRVGAQDRTVFTPSAARTVRLAGVTRRVAA